MSLYKGDSAEYDLIAFAPDSSAIHVQRVDAAIVSKLWSYHLVVRATGEIVREDRHPILKNALPVAARKAYGNWRKELPRGELMVEWFAGQQEKGERLFLVRVTRSAVEAYSATIKADGTLVQVDGQD